MIRQPNFFSAAPKTNMVRISATWPMLIIGMIQFPLMPTCGLPRNEPAQLKYALRTNVSANVTTQSTRMNGLLSTIALPPATRVYWPVTETTFFGGVCGSARLNAASSRDAIPETTYVQRIPCCSSTPLKPLPRTV